MHKYIPSIYPSIPSFVQVVVPSRKNCTPLDRGVTRYERVTRYILQHEEADSRVRKRPWSSSNSVGLLAREAKEYRFSSSFPSSRCLALSLVFHRHTEEESLRLICHVRLAPRRERFLRYAILGIETIYFTYRDH